ncbi:hypothetical protein HDU76_005171 [Blyttiomyces sp. JEL0837]|nr:hypothetical protein HDU76_005171 [Blyttiomyces sp. JEL0837]
MSSFQLDHNEMGITGGWLHKLSHTSWGGIHDALFSIKRNLRVLYEGRHLKGELARSTAKGAKALRSFLYDTTSVAKKEREKFEIDLKYLLTVFLPIRLGTDRMQARTATLGDVVATITNIARNVFDKRQKEFDTPLHHAGYFLNPRYRDRGIPVAKRVMRTQLTEYLAGTGKYSIPAPELSPLTYWDCVKDVSLPDGDGLYAVASRLLSFAASSAGIESTFSITGWIKSDKRRNQLQVDSNNMTTNESVKNLLENAAVDAELDDLEEGPDLDVDDIEQMFDQMVESSVDGEEELLRDREYLEDKFELSETGFDFTDDALWPEEDTTRNADNVFGTSAAEDEWDVDEIMND